MMASKLNIKVSTSQFLVCYFPCCQYDTSLIPLHGVACYVSNTSSSLSGKRFELSDHILRKTCTNHLLLLLLLVWLDLLLMLTIRCSKYTILAAAQYHSRQHTSKNEMYQRKYARYFSLSTTVPCSTWK